MDVSLVMFKNNSQRRDFPVRKDRVVVGRKNTCDLRIPLSSVSREHCEIRLEDDKVHLRDLGSSNGTLLNNVRVQETVLSPGDEITIGPVIFTVVIDGKPSQVKPGKALVEAAAGDDEASGEQEADGPEAIASIEEEDAEVILDESFESDIHTPTTDLDDEDGDDDPIAALERLANSKDDKPRKK